MIVGSARYMKAFVEQHEIGLVTDEQDPESFAEAVRRMYGDPGLYRNLAGNAQKTIPAYYWEETIKKLLEGYKKLA